MAIPDTAKDQGKIAAKSQIEDAIAQAIERVAGSASAPTSWQKAKIMDAIDSATRGLFEVAATHLSQVFLERTAGQPLTPPDVNLTDPATLTIEALRTELERLRSRPLQDPPDYL